MHKIAAFAVKNPVAILMAALGVLLLGILSYSRLGMELFPSLNNPRLYIDFNAGEQPPEEIEKQYVQKLEAQAIRQHNAASVCIDLPRGQRPGHRGIRLGRRHERGVSRFAESSFHVRAKRLA